MKSVVLDINKYRKIKPLQETAVTEIHYTLTTSSQCPHCLKEPDSINRYSDTLIIKNHKAGQSIPLNFKCKNTNCTKEYSVIVTLNAEYCRILL